MFWKYESVTVFALRPQSIIKSAYLNMKQSSLDEKLDSSWFEWASRIHTYASLW